MTRSRFFKKTYHSNYRGKVSVEDAVKHQTYLDDMRKDAVFYCVDHIESSMIPHSMLHKIIQKLKTKQNDSLTLPEKAYLVRQNLNALHSLVEGKISFNQYKKEVVNDRIKHQEQLEAERLRLEKLRELELIQLKKQQEKLAQEQELQRALEAEQETINQKEPVIQRDNSPISENKEPLPVCKNMVIKIYGVHVSEREDQLICQMIDGFDRVYDVTLEE